MTNRRAGMTHVDKRGRVRMVDVGAKRVTAREARAEARVRLGHAMAVALKTRGAIAKGNVLETARIAGIMAAKRTAEVIPMCHPLPLEVVRVDFDWAGDELRIESMARCRSRTGVEMEAMTAAAVAALTVYDMCKSAGKGIVIESVRLLEKRGGKSGHWKAGSR